VNVKAILIELVAERTRLDAAIAALTPLSEMGGGVAPPLLLQHAAVVSLTQIRKLPQAHWSAGSVTSRSSTGSAATLTREPVRLWLRPMTKMVPPTPGESLSDASRNVMSRRQACRAFYRIAANDSKTRANWEHTRHRIISPTRPR
jgi:hypothetical protein